VTATLSCIWPEEQQQHAWPTLRDEVAMYGRACGSHSPTPRLLHYKHIKIWYIYYIYRKLAHFTRFSTSSEKRNGTHNRQQCQASKKTRPHMEKILRERGIKFRNYPYMIVRNQAL